MSSERYNLRDRHHSSIDGVTSRKRTSSKLEVDDSSSNRNIPTVKKRLHQSKSNKVKQANRTFTDSRVKFLAPEILTRVFEYLPLKDRKNVRLTCKLWNEQCTRVLITSREKIVFRHDCRIADVVKMLLKSNFVKMNLEFHTPLVNNLSADMWEKFGHRVRKINFYFGCKLEYETLSYVILHCKNLTSLKLWKGWTPDPSSKMLDSLIDKGVKRRQLSTFATFHKFRHRLIPSPDILEKIFLIFPCVKHFCVRNENYFMESSFDGTPLLLKLPTQLESLKYNVRTMDCWLENPMMPAWKSRLISFEARLTKPKDASRIFQFFAIQKELRSVTLWVTNIDDDDLDRFTKKLMFHVLEHCSKLKEFRMSYKHMHLCLTTQEYHRFLVLISKLRVLSIDFYLEVESAPTLSPINFALNTVSIAASVDNEIPPCNLWKILTNFPRVQHLEITCTIDDLLLQRIFEKMLDLKTLILYGYNKCTSFGFTGKYRNLGGGYSIKRLQQLEHLELWLEFDVTEISFEFQFPRLKHLRLYAKLLDVHEVRQMTCNTPALETLMLCAATKGIFRVEQTIKFCKYLENLKFLRVQLAFKERNLRYATTMGPLFKACPSLRYVQVPYLYRRHCFLYSFDPFSKEVRLDCLREPFYFPGRERFTMFKNKFDHL